VLPWEAAANGPWDLQRNGSVGTLSRSTFNTFCLTLERRGLNEALLAVIDNAKAFGDVHLAPGDPTPHGST